MRVLIVVARQSRMTTYQLPLGIGYISASLKRGGHEVRVLNPNHHVEDTHVLVARAVAEFQPDVIATGGMAFHMNFVRNVAALARQAAPNAIIVVGGVLLTNQPAVIMKAIPEVDVGVIGEGETTILELVDALAAKTGLDAVNGLITRGVAPDDLKTTAPREITKDLDSLPWVDFEGLGLEIYAGLHGQGELAPGLIAAPGTRVMPFLTSRGCPFACTFCCHEAAGRLYRQRSLDDVFAELTAAVERYRIDAVAIYDDVFCLKPRRLEEFCERIGPMKLRWQCSLRVEQVNERILKLMAASGCVGVGIGVESMSPTVLTSMRKSTTREALDRALALIYDHKMTIWANLIFGDPAETPETAQESLDWYAENHRYNMRMAFIGYHPGSRIYKEALADGLIEDEQAYLISDAYEINATTMEDSQYASLRNTAFMTLQAFGFAGKITGIRQLGGSKHEIFAICPHCQADNHYESVALYPNYVNQVACRRCNQIFRTPVVFQKNFSQEERAEIQKLAETISAIPDTRENAAEIEKLCWRIIESHEIGEEAWRRLIAMADRAGNAARAADLLRRLIHVNSYTPDLHDELAKRLEGLGNLKESRKFSRQAEQLRKAGITNRIVLMG